MSREVEGGWIFRKVKEGRSLREYTMFPSTKVRSHPKTSEKLCKLIHSSPLQDAANSPLNPFKLFRRLVNFSAPHSPWFWPHRAPMMKHMWNRIHMCSTHTLGSAVYFILSGSGLLLNSVEGTPAIIPQLLKQDQAAGVSRTDTPSPKTGTQPPVPQVQFPVCWCHPWIDLTFPILPSEEKRGKKDLRDSSFVSNMTALVLHKSTPAQSVGRGMSHY